MKNKEKIPPLVMMRKNIEKRLWSKVRKEDVKKCPTILHHALLRYWDNIVFEKLLERGAHINERNHVDMTPLQFALNYKHNAKLIEILLNYGASVNISSVCGRTPLHIAVVNNYGPHIIEKLLKCGSLINARDNFGMDALTLALSNKHCNVAVVEKLLEHGACIREASDPNDMTDYVITMKEAPCVDPLILCVKLNLNKKIIKLLLKYNASPVKSLRRVLEGLKIAFKQMLPYSIKLLTQFAAIECFENDVDKFFSMFDGIKSMCHLDYAKSCVSELLHMKELFIGESNNLTLYEFLIAKEDQVTSMRENKSVVNGVFNILVSNKFPLYHDMMLSQLGRRGLENILLDTIVSIKSQVSFCCWGSWLIISKHLSKMDLINLIVALRN